MPIPNMDLKSGKEPWIYGRIAVTRAYSKKGMKQPISYN